MKQHFFEFWSHSLYNGDEKATGPFCASGPHGGGPENGRGLGWVVVIAFQGPESQRKDAGGEGCKRGFLNLEIHGFLLEQDSPQPVQSAPISAPRAGVCWIGRERRSLPPSCGRRTLCRSPLRRFLLNPQSRDPRPLVEIDYITRSDFGLSKNCPLPPHHLPSFLRPSRLP